MCHSESTSTRWSPVRARSGSSWGAAGIVMSTVCMFSIAGLIPCAVSQEIPFTVPAGFEVTRFADDALAHNIYSMTVDSAGRIVVAGPQYVKILRDEDGDGVADQCTLYSSTPRSGAHGMVFLGRDLYCTGDNSLMRLRDRDGDDHAEGAPEVLTRLGHSEHGGNGIVHGPDGWLYVACGNDAGVSAEHVTSDRSPILHPRCGTVLRVSPQDSRREVVAHGFRNPYDLDFGPHAGILLVDSDGERDHHLPWYAPTRLLDVAQGREHGWLLTGWQRSWNRPAAFLDSARRLVEIGRGSPTGLVWYRHRQFPRRYRQGVFSACWTLGRIYFMPLVRHGARFRGELETFLQISGDVGFAPVDLAVDPKGDLYVAVGGRGTQGSVFRVRFVGSNPDRRADAASPIAAVLNADQPLSAWSRARWQPRARTLGRHALEDAVADPNMPIDMRNRGIEILVEMYGGLSLSVARQVADQNAPEVVAHVAWGLGRSEPSPEVIGLLARLTHHDDPLVMRRAWEGLAVAGGRSEPPMRTANWAAAVSSPYREVRAAAVTAAKRYAPEPFQRWCARDAGRVSEDRSARRALGWLWILDEDGDAVSLDRSRWETLLRCYQTARGPRVRLDALRLLQRSLGDMRVQPGRAEVLSGYVGRYSARVPADDRRDAVNIILRTFPTEDRDLNREAGRLLGMLLESLAPQEANPHALRKLARFWSDASDPVEDIHYLIISALVPGPRPAEVTKATATALVQLHAKMQRQRRFPSRNWPLRVGEILESLCAHDAELAPALIDHPDFGLPQHSLLVNHLPEAWQPLAARRFLQRVSAGTEREDWTDPMVLAISSLPDNELLPRLRALWADPALRDVIVVRLARRPAAEDRPRFVTALDSPSPDAVERAAEALLALGGRGTTAETAKAIVALRRAEGDESDVPGANTKTLRELLAVWTAEERPGTPAPLPEATPAEWESWFRSRFPKHADLLEAGYAARWDEWKTRLDRLDFETGDAHRGEAVFRSRSCHKCHLTSSRLGPELTGVADRFRREDLFRAIVDPGQSVAPAFRTTQVTTESGRVYQGLLVYESPNGTLLQTGPDQTVRVAGEEITAMEPSQQSLMPTGLLSDATDQDVVDLYAFLRSLGPTRKE